MVLADIPILVQGNDSALTGNAPAILNEVARLLEALVDCGATGYIDIGSLPLSAGDHNWLRERLGRGEVGIVLDGEGSSHVRETDYPGVWWLEHRNPQGVVVAEFIEVSYVPELVPAHPDDAKDGLERLLAELPCSP